MEAPLQETTFQLQVRTARQQAQQRYRNSDKGKAAKLRYRKSDKGRLTAQKTITNWLHTPKGKAYTARYNERRRVSRLVAFNNKYHPEMGDEPVTYEEWISAIKVPDLELIRRRQLVNTLLAKVRANKLAENQHQQDVMDNQTGFETKTAQSRPWARLADRLRRRRISKNNAKRDRHNIVVNK